MLVSAAHGLQILVVEDEMLVAESIKVVLESHGHRVLGPVGTVGAACMALTSAQPDLALLDYRLGEHTSEPLLPDLRERGIPTCVLTGYSREQLPKTYAHVYVLGKPFSMSALVEAIDVMLLREEADDD